jgi:hypothetical protein
MDEGCFHQKYQLYYLPIAGIKLLGTTLISLLVFRFLNMPRQKKSVSFELFLMEEAIYLLRNRFIA